MAILRIRRGLGSEVFALADGGPIRGRTITVAALGMSVPVLAGLLLGHLEAGFTIGLGAILLSGAPTASASAAGGDERPQAAILPVLLAVIAATLIAGGWWSDPAMIGLVAIAALVSGYSRPLGVGAIRFSIYLVLSAGFLDGLTGGRGNAAFIFGLGAVWNIMLRVLLADRASATDALPQPARAPTSKQRRAHFRKTLRTLAGWQFPARLTIGLTMASIIRHLWPAHHFYWIMLTVALLTQRPVEHVPVKTLQRLIGTIAGVGITWLILIGVSSPLILATIVCVLGVLVPIARARSYLLYSLAATPLILLVLDLGKPIETALLADRMAATIIGGAIVIVANVAADRHLNPQGGGALP